VVWGADATRQIAPITILHLCFNIIQAPRARFLTKEIHMWASWVFSKNDGIINLGAIGARFLVSLTGSAWLDLVMGLLVAAIVLRGGVMILPDRADD